MIVQLFEHRPDVFHHARLKHSDQKVEMNDSLFSGFVSYLLFEKSLDVKITHCRPLGYVHVTVDNDGFKQIGIGGL